MSVLTLTLALQKGPPDHHLLLSVTFSLEGPTNERTNDRDPRARNGTTSPGTQFHFHWQS